MDYKIRELKLSDAFKVSKILKKLNLDMDFNKKTQEQIGGELLLSLFGNLYLAEEETGEFLGGLVGLTSQEFNDLPLADSIKIIKQVKDIPEIANFFKQVGDSAILK